MPIVRYGTPLAYPPAADTARLSGYVLPLAVGKRSAHTPSFLLAYPPAADTAHMSGYVLPPAVGKRSAHTPSLRGYF